MPEVPRQILNYYRRDIHVSDTIISADHPDARRAAETPEQEAEPKPVPMMRRILGKFTIDTSASTDSDEEGRRL